MTPQVLVHCVQARFNNLLNRVKQDGLIGSTYVEAS